MAGIGRSEQDAGAPPPWKHLGRGTIAATTLLGLVYIGAQIALQRPVADAIMVAIVVLNVSVVQVFGNFIATQLDDMFVAFGETPERAREKVARILGHPAAPLFGIVYASVFAAIGWVLDPWSGTTLLRLLLAVFIFSGSFFIGVAIFAILLYWRAVLRALPDLDMRILTLSRPPLLPFLKVNSLIVTTTAAIACLAIIAAVFSRFDLEGTPVLAFSGFTLAVAVLSYAVPILPLSNYLRLDKAREIDRIDRLIEAHIRRLTGQPDRVEDALLPEPLPDLEDLQEARRILEAVRTLPPGGQISVSAAAIVAFLSFLPSLLDYARTWIMGAGG